MAGDQPGGEEMQPRLRDLPAARRPLRLPPAWEWTCWGHFPGGVLIVLIQRLAHAFLTGPRNSASFRSRARRRSCSRAAARIRASACVFPTGRTAPSSEVMGPRRGGAWKVMKSLK